MVPQEPPQGLCGQHGRYPEGAAAPPRAPGPAAVPQEGEGPGLGKAFCISQRGANWRGQAHGAPGPQRASVFPSGRLVWAHCAPHTGSKQPCCLSLMGPGSEQFPTPPGEVTPYPDADLPGHIFRHRSQQTPTGDGPGGGEATCPGALGRLQVSLGTG